MLKSPLTTKLQNADRPNSRFNAPLRSAATAKNCVGVTPTMLLKSLIMCDWSKKPRVCAISAQELPFQRARTSLLLRATRPTVVPRYNAAWATASIGMAS